MQSTTFDFADQRLAQEVHRINLLISHPKPYSSQTLVPMGISMVFPRGVTSPSDYWLLQDQEGVSLPFQSSPLQRWPDGSIKWLRVEWLHTPQCGASKERLSFQVYKGVEQCVEELSSGQPCGMPEQLAFQLSLVDSEGLNWTADPVAWRIEEDGPIFQRLHGVMELRTDSKRRCPIAISCALRFYPRIGCAITRLRIRNPQPSGHPGGTWDLGNKGSFLMRDLSIEYPGPSPSTSYRYWVQVAPDQPCHQADQTIQLFQASSGGENWNSRNHIDRSQSVPLPFRGFVLHCDNRCERGERSSPRAGIAAGGSQIVFAMRDYWENFPKCISIHENRLRLGIFPKESGYLHELQGGEQKTHQWAVCIQNSEDPESLAWYRSPSWVSLSPESYASAHAVPHLTPRAADPNRDYVELVDGAIDGSETLISKREKIDQYGWRNYGDLYGDHEAVFGESDSPLISHYNNQYDCVGAFAIQYLRSGRQEWWDQMIAMADHAWDIDTYHTDGDKNLYNGGLFWHTYHYADADIATHRSYPSKLSQLGRMPGGNDLSALGKTGKGLAKVYAIGGGPSASHNYPTGWMHAYFLTGEPDYREAAILAADYVSRIEDGTKTIFRLLSRSDTGLSIESGIGYYGPGRASGNSLNALLTGYELTENSSYLESAEKLIRRVVHPEEDIGKLDLLNAELRWFYTMFLQALMRYIDIKAARGLHDDAYAYGWASLVHYGRWMLAHEMPTLNHPERLQYPNETWAAQDMRKWHILQYLAWLNPGSTEEQERFQAKADYFFQYVCTTLRSMPSHRLCRPTVLLMHFGWQRSWFVDPKNNSSDHPRPSRLDHFPARLPFVSQRTRAVRRLKMAMAISTLLAITALSVIAAMLLR